MATDFTVLNLEPKILGSTLLPSLPPRTAISNRGELARDLWRSDKLLSFDQCRLMVDRLFLSAGAAKSVVFAGLDPASGCTQTVFAAAETLAVATHKTVCVVDANAYSPTLGSRYDLSTTRGLSDALMEERSVLDFVQRLDNGNLCVLPYGRRPVADTQKKGACFWIRDSISQLKSLFDYVLVDAPAASTYSDAITLGAAVGGLALVIQSGSARRDVAARTIATLKKADLRMLGVIVTAGKKSPNRQALPR